MTSVAKKKSKKTDKKDMDINALILRDHKPIKKLLAILKDDDVSLAKKRATYPEFEKALSAHAKAEEESLYVHMKDDTEVRVEGFEGDIEHNIAERLMKELNRKSTDDEWIAKVKVLAEVVEHHVKEEEEETLKKVRAEFDRDERVEIGQEYLQCYEEESETRVSKEPRADREMHL